MAQAGSDIHVAIILCAVYNVYWKRVTKKMSWEWVHRWAFIIVFWYMSKLFQNMFPWCDYAATLTYTAMVKKQCAE